MKCPKCQAEILDDSQFCSKCGTPIHPGDKAFLSHTHTIVRPIDELVPGTELSGKYKIVDVVGKGGMGIVYKAVDIRLKRNVALKFLPPELTKDKEAKERFVLEAQAAAALSHPNICTIHEIDEEEGKAFIAMEYVEGQSLKNKIDKGPVSPEEAVDIAIQVAEGLEEAHRKGIIHRDIKSANIMITEKGQAKIMDFGLAKVKGGTLLTREGTTLGTVAYMSPEQARGEEVDQRTDIWSLGIVLYEMLSGQLPFMGDREASILYSVVHEEAKPVTVWNPQIPSQLQQIIDRALKKKTNTRYSLASEMLKELQKYRDSLKAEELGALSFRSVLRKIRKPIVAIPTLFIIAVIATAAVWFFNRQAKIRYARKELLPEIERLVISFTPAMEDWYDGYKLALKAEKYIPHDPKLNELLKKCAGSLSIHTEPQGAKISIKKYSALKEDWEFLGISPIENVRGPQGTFRWKMEKEGYETVYAVDSTIGWEIGKDGTYMPKKIVRGLDEVGTIPPEMVRVKGTEEIPDFFIDRYEVTNKQYKEFVDSGAYLKKEFWPHPFTKNGEELTWEEAMAEFVDETGRPGPATWQAGSYAKGQDDYPVNGISWYEANAYASFRNKSLPTVEHWALARGEDLRLWTLDSALFSQSNLKEKGPAKVGSHQGMLVYGTYDMAGNVREWCWNKSERGRCIRGGAWNDATYMYNNITQASEFNRSEKNGIRCVMYLDKDNIPDETFGTFTPRAPRDWNSEEPASDAVFEAYENQFSYDKTELNAKVEWRDESSEDWIQEKITFDAAYGNERMIAHLYLPKKFTPPFQPVIYFPGSGSMNQETSENLSSWREFEFHLSFLVANGRAVLYPIYKGTFERKNGIPYEMHLGDSMTHQYVEFLKMLVQDCRRSIDFLEIRPEIDMDKLAYFGFSWGGRLGIIISAIEDRIKLNILYLGGMPHRYAQPEAEYIHYVTRVKIPTLMLNGQYDMIFPYETAVIPMFELLGTPDEDKKIEVYPTDHFVPRNELIKESLAWLDKYFGRPKK